MRYFLIMVLVLLLSGCTLVKPAIQEIPEVKDQAKVEGVKNQDSQPVVVGDNLIYTNKKYDFNLTLPKDWAGYASAERVLDWGDLGKSDSIDFGFKKEAEIESLFNISIHSNSQWKKIQAADGPVPTYLGEDNGIVLGWSGSQDASPENVTRRSQVDEIIKSFRWVEEK